ncbi:MAG: Wzy polymerase domain-containing protein [Sideroxydans sp.]|nr:Wzy polymerase domain-containing protein [Sideroxydans sp.]
MLKKYIPSSFGLAHISLAFIGLMWVLPFLYYYHNYPITTFYQEWGTAILGLCAMPLLLTARYWQAPEVPRIVLLPLGLMMVVMVQFFIGRIGYLDQLLMLSLYFLFAALLIMLGQRLREELGLPAVATTLAVFLLLGAELNTLAGIVQHFRWNTFLNSVVTVKTSSAVYGNIAQPNHFSNYIALGLFSLGLLQARGSLRVWQTALLATPMLFVLVLSGSRSAWLYLSFALALAWLLQRRNKALRPLLAFAAALWLGFAAMHFVVQLPWLQGTTGSVTSAERLFAQAEGSSIRFQIWREAGLIFAQFPVFGAGFGQFAYQHLQLAATMQNTGITGLYNNTHNIVLQLAAETGLAGLAVLFGTLGIWLWQTVARKTEFTLYHWWGYAILAVLGIHSLLEYPLWYAYFIGIAAVMLGVFDTSGYRLELPNVGRLSVAAIVLLGAMVLAQGVKGYRHLENALAYGGQAATNPNASVNARDELMAAYQYPLFSPYAEMFIAGMMQPSADHLADKLQLNSRALRFIPEASEVYHQAWLLALSDRPDEAKKQLENAIWAYPADYDKARAELEALASKDHARFDALLEFATRKYEEYRRAAVFAK